MFRNVLYNPFYTFPQLSHSALTGHQKHLSKKLEKEKKKKKLKCIENLRMSLLPSPIFQDKNRNCKDKE